MERIAKSQRVTYIRWMPVVLIVLLSVLVYHSKVFSWERAEQLVRFQDKEWDLRKEFNQKWLTNESNVTFTVDLGDDYEKRFKNQDPENGEGKQLVERPFEVKAEYDGKELEAAYTVQEPEFSGEYMVSVPLPADSQEGELSLQVHMLEENSWEISESTSDFKIIHDQTAPVIELSNVQSDELHKEAVPLVVAVRDKNISADDVEVSVKRNGTAYTISPKQDQTDESLQQSYTFTQGGDYEVTVTAKDEAGNEAETKQLKFAIEKKDSTLTLEGIVANGYTSGKTIGVKLEGDRILYDAEIQVTKDGEPYTQVTSEDFEYLGGAAWLNHRFAEEGKYELRVSVTNLYLFKEDKTDVFEPVVFTIDNTSPKLSIAGVESGKKYRESREVSIAASDANLDPDRALLEVTKDGKPYAVDRLKAEGGKAEGTYTFAEDGVYEIRLEAADLAGNKRVLAPVVFTIDKEAPKLSITGVTNGEHYNEDRDVNVTVEDLTLPQDDGQWVCIVTKDGEPYTGMEPLKRKGNKAEANHVFSEEGTYEISLGATDELGNASELKPVTFVIDKTTPVVKMDGISDQAFVQQGKTLTVQVDEQHFETNQVDLVIQKDGVVYEQAEAWKHTGEHSVWKHTFNEEGRYEVTVAAKDAAGNEAASQAVRFTVDQTAPAITITGAEQDFYYNEGRNVTVKVNETNFQTNEVRVSITKDGQAVSAAWENKSEVSARTYELTEDGSYEIRVEAADAAGNKAESKSVAFTVDTTKPELSISGVERGASYNTTQTVDVLAADSNIDFEKTVLSVTRDGKAYDVGELKKQDGKASLRFDFAEEGSYVLQLKSTDKAGNTVTHEAVAFIIDKTNPVVQMEGAENGSFNPSERTVTVSVDEQYYETNTVELTVTRNGKQFDMGEWRNEGKLSKLSYQFREDGLYTIAVTSKDKAGNGPVSRQLTFTIDQTSPQISIKGVDQDAHYNVDKTVSLSVTDVNMQINKLTVTRDGRSYSAGSLSVPSSDGMNEVTAVLSHSFSGEGLYAIAVEAIDRAGNRVSSEIQFTIDKTKPVITPKMRGEERIIQDGAYINKVFTPEFALDQAEDVLLSVILNSGENVVGRIPAASAEMMYSYAVTARDKAGNETKLNVSFTVDTTKPELVIKGVLDGFFNDNVAPAVAYSDLHLDSSKTTIKLNGKPFVSGTKLKEERDYVLEAAVADLAENVSKRSIVFTIDKTAPSITFKEPISEKYFNEDLIPALLIDDMSEYDIIACTLDGQEYELGAPIRQEGKHVLYLEIKDKAGNVKQLSVEFIIDKTAPKVIYEGAVQNGVYYEAVDLGIRLSNPSDVIKSVMINGELFEGEVVEENGSKVIKTTLADQRPYEVQVVAYDTAGNEVRNDLAFKIAAKELKAEMKDNTPLLAGSILMLGVTAAAATLFFLRRRKNVTDEEVM